MRTLLSLATLLVGLVLLFSAPTAKADCPHNGKMAHSHCDGVEPLPPGITLGDLSCTTDQIAKYNGINWVCAADGDTDTDTLGALNCSSGQIAKFNGSNWACGVDADTDTDTDNVANVRMIASPNSPLTKSSLDEVGLV